MAEQIKQFTFGRIQFNVFLDSQFDIERHLLDKGVWELHLLASLEHLPRAGNTCVDVGANFGFYTLSMASLVGDSGKVLAFEPNKLIFDRLVRNVALNPELQSRIELFNYALGAKNTTLNVYQSGGGNAYLGTTPNSRYFTTGDPALAQSTAVKPLDEVLAGKRLDLIKIDVEGMEGEVLHGARQLLQQFSPVIVLETLLECFDNNEIRKTEEWLREMGYFYFASDFALRKLRCVTYPNLQEDSVAIPRNRLGSFLDVLHPVNSYKLPQGNDSLMPQHFAKMELLLYSIPAGFTLITMSVGEETGEAPVYRRGKALLAEFTFQSGTVTLELEFSDHSLRSARGSVKSNDLTFTVSLEKVFGDLDHEALYC